MGNCPRGQSELERCSGGWCAQKFFKHLARAGEWHTTVPAGVGCLFYLVLATGHLPRSVSPHSSHSCDTAFSTCTLSLPLPPARPIRPVSKSGPHRFPFYLYSAFPTPTARLGALLFCGYILFDTYLVMEKYAPPPLQPLGMRVFFAGMLLTIPPQRPSPFLQVRIR